MTTKTKKPVEVKLPNKLSDVIDIAVKDLRAVERSKQYDVNMYDWHDGYVRPDVGQPAIPCSVCFAGAVMAKTMKAPIESDVTPSDFSDHNYNRFNALDTLRSGSVEEALNQIGRNLPFGIMENVNMPSYDYDPEGFKDTMKKLAKTLRAVGE